MTVPQSPATLPLAVFEALEVAILLVDARGEVLFANQAFCRSVVELSAGSVRGPLTGARRTELFERLTTYLVNPEHARACWRRAAADQEMRMSVLELRDGTHIRQTVKPVELPGGRGLLGEFVDLEVQAKVLQDSDSEYRKIFEEGPVGITVVDIADFSYVRVNQRMAEIVGYTLTELLERSFAEITHPEDRDLDVDLAGQMFAGTVPFYQIDKRFLHKQGHVVWGRLTATLIRDAHGRPLYGLGLVEDISAHKQAEERRQRLETQLHHSQKLESIGLLASGIAHEINNPLQGVLSYAELIAEDPAASVGLREQAEEIIHECEHMSAIVRNLLSFARREPAPRSAVAVTELVSGAHTLIRAMLRHDGIALELDVPTELPAVHCSAQQIRQVILNLLTNARDALNERYPGHDPNKRIELRARARDDGFVELGIHDYGAGMSPELQEHVFDPFFTTKNSERGTGLGLSITHTIVEEHGGTLRVESELGAKTSFFVRLPVA